MKRVLAFLAVVVVLSTLWSLWRARERAAVPELRRSEGTLPLAADAQTEAIESEIGTDERQRVAPSALRGDGPAALRVLVLDGANGQPVAGVALSVQRELAFGAARELAQAISDAHGRAQFAELDPGLVIVVAHRHPPLARAFGAAEIQRGRTSVVEIHLGPGGSVRGRVVDSAHRPIAGAEILLAGDGPPGAGVRLEALTRIAAHSDAEGRFELDAIGPAPADVSLDAGRLVARAWEPEIVWARRAGLGASADAEVQPFQTRELGELVIEDANRLAGIVLDAAAQPVAGALVSLREERAYAREYKLDGSASVFALGPGQPGFVLGDREVLSDPAGRFALDGHARQVVVWTTDGLLQSFPLPDFAPGASADDLVLRLRANTRLEIELVDASAERVRGESEAARQSDLHTEWRSSSPTHGLCADFEFAAGAPLRQHVQCDPDGLWRFDLPAERGEPRSLELRLGGWSLVRDELAGKPLTHLRYVLEELPALHLRLHSTDSSEEAQAVAAGLQLQLACCLASPEQRAAADPGDRRMCCGRGSSLPVSWDGEDLRRTLLCGERRPFWIYVQGYSGHRTVDLAHVGPFTGGAGEHELALSLKELRARLDARAERAPPVQAPEPRGKIVARLVDSDTGAPLDKAWLEGRRPEEADAPRRSLGGRIDADGRFEVSARAGAWQLYARARGHAEFVLENVLVRAGGTADLGTLRLAPRPLCRARLLHHDGTPSGPGTYVFALPGMTRGETDAEGRFTLDADLPPAFALQVHERELAGSDSWSAQVLHVESWDPQRELELRLSAWRTVELHIGGPAAEVVEARMKLVVDAAPEAGLASTDLPQYLPSAVHTASAARVLRLALVAGHYEISGGGLLARLPRTPIDVRDTEEPQVFELASR